MEVLKRSQHFTDFIKNETTKTRKISNFLNYKNHLGDWNETEISVENQGTPPPAWSGTYDFSFGSSKAPLQFFARDAMDVGNRAMVGIRLSDEPNKWINFKAKNVDNSVDVIVEGEKAKWVNLWTNTDFEAIHKKNQIKINYILKGEGHPAFFEETLKLSNNLSLKMNEDNSISVMDSESKEKFKINAPFGYNEKGDMVRCLQTIEPKTGVFETIRITPNAEDIALVGYETPIIIDPTTTISGTDALEDNNIQQVSGSDNLNYGSYTFSYFLGKQTTAGNPVRRALLRILEPSTNIPAGTLTEARWMTTRTANATNSVNGGTLYFYPMKNANDWVEGTATGSQQDGSSCWLYAKYDTQAWAGSAGASTIGTGDNPAEASVDYDLTPSASFLYTGYTSGSPIPFNVIIGDTSSLVAWRDGTRTNNGWLVKTNEASIRDMLLLGFPTESASSQWYIEIDYEGAVAATDNAIFFSMNF